LASSQSTDLAVTLPRKLITAVAVFGSILGLAASALATTATVPKVTLQPKSQTVTAGASVTFKAAASGYPKPTVYWRVIRKGTDTWTKISGATSTTLTLADVQTSMSGNQYGALFTNRKGRAGTAKATLTVNPVVPPPPTSSWWTPPANAVLQWEISHPLSLTSAADMGTNGTVYTGAASAAPAVYDIDGFDNPASTVSALHALGKNVICYVDIGTAENFRPDYSQFPAGILGKSNGWPGESWINISPSGPYYAQLQAIMLARLQMCASKGFDAVEPDNMDGSENSTGFTITTVEDNTYVEWIAAEAHSLGMGVLQKNYVDQSATLQPYFDGVLDEQCAQYNECSSLQPYASAGKAVWEVEYSASPSSFCPSANVANRNAYLLPLSLDGSSRVTCR
jgi:hypothetical protein